MNGITNYEFDRRETLMRLSAIAKRMLLVVCLSLPLLAAGGFAYYRSLAFLPFLYGAALGTALGAAKVILLDRAVTKIAGMEKDRAMNYARLQQLLRFLLTGAVLVTAAVVPFISLWGAAASVLAYQAAVYSLKLFEKKGR